MRNIKRLLQFNLYAMVVISSLLLGLAMESTSMIVIAVVGATLGFVITDLLKIFQLRGLIANIASILILILAMKDFFPEDGTGKLVSVANLLVYLQTVLMFQEKTPRLNWQVLVLSLLQVVVSAIFSLDLEGGLLFMAYFLVVGSAMFLQSIYSQQWEIETSNRESSSRVSRMFGGSPKDGEPGARPEPAFAPVVFFDTAAQAPLKLAQIGSQLVVWASVAFTFTVIMFYLAPRHAKPWYGPMAVQVTTAGVSKSVDLDERGIIDQSSQLMFRVKFRNLDGTEAKVLGAPYFRGLALSSLVIRNGKTDWQAPQDRVSIEHYQEIPTLPAQGIPVYQVVTMEETDDPLVYGVFPFYRSENTSNQIMFCHEISALTRCKLRETIDLAPYKYQAATILDSRGRFSQSWPYVSNTKTYVQRPMSEDPPQVAWLTEMDPDRYRTIATLSDQLAADFQERGGGRIEFLKSLETYFRSPGRFRYTLDFRRIKRDESLDPVEDFVRNHRSGHCELYASALTLMLRHQGIPARLVVGFHGGSYNSTAESYLVRANNAHAWVEAYLRPEDCTEDMRLQGQAGPGGAWMILDATPIALGGGGGNRQGEAIDLARNAWDDYVLGMDNEDQRDQGYTLPMFRWLRDIDVDYIESTANRLKQASKQNWFRFGIPAAIVLGLIALIVVKRLREGEPGEQEERPVGRFRRMLASAISFISPELGQWVMGRGKGRRVEFYERMTELLADLGYRKSPFQTHRDFAQSVVDQFRQHPQYELIDSTINEVTERFNQVRFGKRQLNDDLLEKVGLRIDELKMAIAQSPMPQPS